MHQKLQQMFKQLQQKVQMFRIESKKQIYKMYQKLLMFKQK